MFKQCLLAALVAIFGAAQPEQETKMEMARLAGRWQLIAVEFKGQNVAWEGDAERPILHFAGDQLTRYRGSKKSEVVRFEIQLDEDFKFIDFVPIEGDDKFRVGSRQKCLYSLKDDILKIAFTSAQDTPDDDKEQQAEHAKKRPKSFDTKRGDVGVFTLKREQAETVVKSAGSEVRKWTDKTGKRTVEAELISYENGTVRLKRADGKDFSLRLDKLSDADQEYVRTHLPEPTGSDTP